MNITQRLQEMEDAYRASLVSIHRLLKIIEATNTNIPAINNEDELNLEVVMAEHDLLDLKITSLQEQVSALKRISLEMKNLYAQLNDPLSINELDLNHPTTSQGLGLTPGNKGMEPKMGERYVNVYDSMTGEVIESIALNDKDETQIIQWLDKKYDGGVDLRVEDFPATTSELMAEPILTDLNLS